MFDQVPLDTLFSVPQRNGLTKPKRLRGEGVKMVNMGELFAERRIQELPMDRVPCSERELETNRLEKGDLLFARQSLTLEGAGQSSIFLGDQEDVVFESHLIRCRLDKSRVDPLYYFYFFESKFGKQRIGSIVEQVAAAGIRGSDLIKLPVFLPSLSDQKAIAHILGTLDDKIELNQKMNQTLEEIAKAIFKSWFVDFDPVRAKAEGRPTGLPPEISDLFPDELVDSEIGEIPKGWGLRRLDSLLELAYGKSLPAKNRLDGEVPVYGSGGVNGFHNEPLVEGTSIVVGRKGTVGSLYWVDKPFFPIDTVFYVRTEESIHYCFYLMQTLRLETMNTDAAVPGLNRDNAYRLQFPNAPTTLVNHFSKITKSTRDRISIAEEENKVLSELRDTLLPKLISGELRIPDAEKFLEEAGI